VLKYNYGLEGLASFVETTHRTMTRFWPFSALESADDGDKYVSSAVECFIEEPAGKMLP
jgi:hypothetical protein